MSEFLSDAELISLSIVFAALVIAWAIVNLAGQVARQLGRTDSVARNIATMRRIMRENQTENREVALRMADSIDGLAKAGRLPGRRAEAVAPVFGRTTPKV